MIDLGLIDDNKWSDESQEHPVCALCGVQIGGLKCRLCDGSGTFEFTNNNDGQDFDSCGPCDGTGVEQAVPVRVWRDHPTKPGKKQEMAFHLECEKGGIGSYLVLDARLEELTFGSEATSEATALERLRLHELMDELWKTLDEDERRQLDARDA